MPNTQVGKRGIDEGFYLNFIFRSGSVLDPYLLSGLLDPHSEYGSGSRKLNDRDLNTKLTYLKKNSGQ